MISVAKTIDVNPEGTDVTLTRADVWRGLEAKANNALPFVPDVTAIEGHGFCCLRSVAAAEIPICDQVRRRRTCRTIRGLAIAPHDLTLTRPRLSDARTSVMNCAGRQHSSSTRA